MAMTATPIVAAPSMKKSQRQAACPSLLFMPSRTPAAIRFPNAFEIRLPQYRIDVRSPSSLRVYLSTSNADGVADGMRMENPDGLQVTLYVPFRDGE